MARSKWKISTPISQLDELSAQLKSVQSKLPANLVALNWTHIHTPLRIKSRAAKICPELVGSTIQVHQGSQWIRVRITRDMIGHCLGEFARSHRAGMHKKKKTK